MNPSCRNIYLACHLVSEMGIRYVLFRAWFRFQQKCGILKTRFRGSRKLKIMPSVDEWRSGSPEFLIRSRKDIKVPRIKTHEMEKRYREIREGRILYFSHARYDQGREFNWHKNPVNGHVYDSKTHWSDINDLSKADGDIKYVWELSRFGFLFDIIRYDHHFSQDSSEFAFQKILSWIRENPADLGPNYKCSQEISLRILTWIYILHFYSDSKHLTNPVFHTLLQSIYDQVRHVKKNINFSRISVRNNHALSETLALFVTGLLFPFLPGAGNWKRRGKKWFEKEVRYQIYPDGTYLQFSMNYHRVVIQLLSWAIRMSELHRVPLRRTTSERAGKSLDFLYHSMHMGHGRLPAYGANDGALFFRFNDDSFNDFRGQLHALSCILKKEKSYNWEDYRPEDHGWYGLDSGMTDLRTGALCGSFSFAAGGYYIMREKESFTFIRCGRHRNRPSHADNLHLDLWHKGKNYIMDAGSFSYNTENELLRYFSGTAAHNTVRIKDYDQMEKGPNFIWFNWTQALDADLQENDSEYIFKGTISAYRHVRKGIRHTRTIIKKKSIARWIVKDEMSTTDGLLISQLWHLAPGLSDKIVMNSSDANGNSLEKKVSQGWISEYYGQKQRNEIWSFDTLQNEIITTIEIND
jgi:hypothetical protein